MINVKSIDRGIINSWPIDVSGLPPRVVNSSNSANIRTVGELRKLTDKQLKASRGIGAGSIANIHRFFRICDEIESGSKRFASLKSIFDFFLTPVQYDILVMRYGLHKEEITASRTHVTLQAIGSKYRICRERVRQMENAAKKALGSRLGQACLGEVYGCFEAFIKKNHCVATCSDIAALQNSSILGDYNRCSMLLLLCDCSQRLSCHNSFFTTLPRDRIRQIETQAVDFLRTSNVPQSFPKILEALSSTPVHDSPETSRQVIRYALNHFPDIAATTDDRYFIPESGAPHIVREIMGRLPSPVHFRTIMREFNRLMQSGSRKGAGHVLDVLLGNPQFSRTSSGYYELRGSAADDN